MHNSDIEYIKQSIQKDVFFREEIQKISLMSGHHDKWIFDFRMVMLQSQFLNAYSEVFLEDM